jgi:hypothetical protein
MATLTRQAVNEDGLDIVFASAAVGGDVVTNQDGKTFILVKNGSGGAITVTVAEQVSGSTVEDPVYGTVSKASATISIANGGTGIMGPFKKTAFNNASNQIEVTYSGVTSVTIAALYIPANI